MKTPIEMLNAIIEMQEANYGNATNTHLDLSTLVREAREVVKNCSIPDVVGQSEQLTCQRCKSTNILNPDKDNDAQCIECGFVWAG